MGGSGVSEIQEIIMADAVVAPADDRAAAVLRGFAVMAIASPQFAYRACLADELGLLPLLMNGRLQEAAALASEILATLPVDLPDDLEAQVRQAWISARHALCSVSLSQGLPETPMPSTGATTMKNQIEADARYAMARHGLEPLAEPMGEDHHTDAAFTTEDHEIAELAYWLGGLFIDKEAIDPERPHKETYYYNEMSSFDVWMRVARALRVHGLKIVNASNLDRIMIPQNDTEAVANARAALFPAMIQWWDDFLGIGMSDIAEWQSRYMETHKAALEGFKIYRGLLGAPALPAAFKLNDGLPSCREAKSTLLLAKEFEERNRGVGQ
jgi:hypothetical protein